VWIPREDAAVGTHVCEVRQRISTKESEAFEIFSLFFSAIPYRIGCCYVYKYLCFKKKYVLPSNSHTLLF
jgi:hypothetical protein